jgi:hypothetical protein
VSSSQIQSSTSGESEDLDLCTEVLNVDVVVLLLLGSKLETVVCCPKGAEFLCCKLQSSFSCEEEFPGVQDLNVHSPLRFSLPSLENLKTWISTPKVLRFM